MIRRMTFSLVAALALMACQPDEAGHHGYVEGEFLRIGPDEAGRLTSLTVREGETVEPGAPLFAMDQATFLAERDQAQGRLTEARAALANLLAEQQRPEEIQVLLARKERAQADLTLARTDLERQRRLFKDGFAPQARLDTAQATFERASAALEEIDQEIRAARLTARIQLIEQAQGAVRTAEASVALAQERLARRTVSAPAGAYVQDVFFRPGEVVPAGRAIVSLLPPERRRIIFYVDEPSRARFEPGTKVIVTCDSCPPALEATVDWISAEQEFTPPVIFSPEERARLVYRLEAAPQGALPLAPGQPVSVFHTDDWTPDTP